MSYSPNARIIDRRREVAAQLQQVTDYVAAPNFEHVVADSEQRSLYYARIRMLADLLMLIDDTRTSEVCPLESP
jgi:hypothetical protein